MTTRKEFFGKLEPFHAPSTLLSMETAYTLAKFSHRAQVRKETDASGKPVRYFEHVRRVALILIEVGILDADLIISALLHDGLEDTRDITPAMIEHLFGKEVVKIVKLLSKVPKEGYLERLTLCQDWRVLTVKAADRLDNLRSLKSAPMEFQIKQIKETVHKYYPLFGDMTVYAPAQQQRGRLLLWRKIQDTVAAHSFAEPSV